MEIDGGYHYTATQKEKDKRRDAMLIKMGYDVIRVSNTRAMKKIELKRILKDKIA